MPTTIPTTEFAPAERAAAETLKRQTETVRLTEWIVSMANAVPEGLLVVNTNRQIIFANHQMIHFLHNPETQLLLGQRPGEAFNCLRATAAPAGCGTSHFCSVCGTTRAILTAQQGTHDVQECRINTLAGSHALNFDVATTPVTIQGEQFVIFALRDISDVQRRRALERIFFHDIMNLAGGMQGLAEVLAMASPEDTRQFQPMVLQLAHSLVEEINAQRDLTSAESGELAVHPGPLQARALLEELRRDYQNHSVASNRVILVHPQTEELAFESDHVLIRRVIGNMLKNALEASKEGETVTLCCRRLEAELEFSVHNPAVMPHEVQLQMFQRSFTTKGNGRGLGTFSLKLIGEQYLKGQVSFHSAEGLGTTFTLRLPIHFVP